MLIGHYAPALLLQRNKPALPLWLLLVAAQAVDFLWALFVLCGVEWMRIRPGMNESNSLDLAYMPYSHSLVATVGWATLAAVAWWLARGRDRRALGEGVVIGLVVASHYLLDVVVHTPDMPLFHGDGVKLGLGLWRHRTLALAVEGGLFALAALYWLRRRADEPPRRASAILLSVMLVVLVVSFYTPTPPSPQAMAATGLSIWIAVPLLAAWAARADARALAGAAGRRAA